MPRTILIIDVSHLCYRAMYSSPDLSNNGIRTGVVYGTLREIMELRIRFNADMTVFCFDSQQSKRREFFPNYKTNRRTVAEIESRDKEQWDEHDAAKMEMVRQMLDMRLKYLSWAGFSNILIKNGYEADDLAASIVLNSITDDDTVFLVTGDKDYYQLLRHNVIMYDAIKKTRTTLQTFYQQYGFEATRYWEYLAVCGCGTDTVPGIPGIGPVAGDKWMKLGDEKMPARQHMLIGCRAGREIRARNEKLVRLPYEGCPKFELKPDKFNLQGWRKVCDELGARSLRNYTK